MYVMFYVFMLFIRESYKKTKKDHNYSVLITYFDLIRFYKVVSFRTLRLIIFQITCVIIYNFLVITTKIYHLVYLFLFRYIFPQNGF